MKIPTKSTLAEVYKELTSEKAVLSIVPPTPSSSLHYTLALSFESEGRDKYRLEVQWDEPCSDGEEERSVCIGLYPSYSMAAASIVCMGGLPDLESFIGLVERNFSSQD